MKRGSADASPTRDLPTVKKPKMDDTENEWTKVEKRKHKKVLRGDAIVESSSPRFMYANHEIIKRSHAIAIDDIRDLILHLVADASPPNWLRIDKVNMIQKVVAILVPGLTPEILSLPPLPTSATLNPNLPLSIPLLPPSSTNPSSASSIPFIASTFSHACPTRAPGDQNRMHSVVSAFFSSPISGEEKKRRMTQRLQSETNKEDVTQYLMTLDQMIEHDYPIPSYLADVFEKPSGWLETPKPAAGENKWNQKIYAIDCEMCVTEDGKELTRVCVIDYTTGTVVYDQLVKPQKPILDYLTRWSGITPEALNPVTTTLQEVQAHILRLLSPPAPNPFSKVTESPSRPAPTPILVGHSLESDLKALKICHPRCIDTAIIYHHSRGRPLKPGLAWLTKKWCGRDIQTRGEGGHDPEEDARACIELLKKKLENGPGFGEFKVDFESIFERMARASSSSVGGGRQGRMGGPVKSAVVDLGNPAAMHGAKATTALGCKDDDEVVEKLVEVLPSHQFVFARLTGLANALGWITPKIFSDQIPYSPPLIEPPPSLAELQPVLASLNSHLSSIYRSIPSSTALIIFTGHSDPRKMALLNAKKIAFENALKSGKTSEETTAQGLTWSTSDVRELEEAVALARRGLLFLGVKP